MRPLGSDNTAIQFLRHELLGEKPRKDFIGLRPDTLCNYKCVSCQQIAGKCQVTDNEFRDFLAEYGRQRVICSISGGEPLLTDAHFTRVTQLVRVCTTLGLYPTLFTNCHNLNPVKVGDLLLAGLKRLTTAFYGAEATTHDRFRGKPGSFKTQYAALKMLCQKKRECGLEFHLAVSIVFFRDNYRQLLEMISLLGSMFGDEINSLEFFPIKEYEDLYLTADDVRYFRQALLPEAQRLLRRYNYVASARKLEEIMQGRPQEGVYGELPSRCYSSYTSLYVSGRERLVYPCGYMADYAERHPDKAVVLGRVGEPLDLGRLNDLPLPVCESLCGPPVKAHNRRAERAVEIMRQMPDIADVLRLPSYENQLILRLREEYLAKRGSNGAFRK